MHRGLPSHKISLASKKYVVVVLSLWISVLIFYQTNLLYHHSLAGHWLKPGSHEFNITVHELPNVPRVILFPRDFKADSRQQLVDLYTEYSGTSLPQDEDTFFIGKHYPDRHLTGSCATDHTDDLAHIKSLPFTPSIADESYVEQLFNVYTHGADDTFNEECSRIRHNFKVETNQYREIGLSLQETVASFYHSDYYQEHADVFLKNPLEKQLEARSVSEYWFRFGGSSVYLEQYGVHFMVSRLTYSSRKDKGIGDVTFLVGEVYDRQWQLIPGAELIVPTNDPDSTSASDQVHYTVYSASSVLAMPIFHRMKTVEGTFFGTEDPRLILVQNSRGYEEPVAVFNQNHRKLVEIEENNLDNPKFGFKQYRSLFQSYLWQTQRGKTNVDGVIGSEHIHADVEGSAHPTTKLFVKTVELRVAHTPRLSMQKNWTPFTSVFERRENGYDKYIYFVIRWTDLEVLRCTTDEFVSGVPVCIFVHRAVENKPITDDPGPFRGGTALVSVNALLEANAHMHPLLQSAHQELSRSKREVWVGFARAHFKDCGCGPESFYRLNFVVVTRAFDGSFSVSVAGLYTSLGVPVPGWHMDTPEKLCTDGLSVLIANLIAQWSVMKDRHGMIQDYATLTLSVSDANNEVLHVKGLLAQLLAMSQSHSETFGGTGGRELPQRYNAHLECALHESRQFCLAFGAAYFEWEKMEKGIVL